MSALAIPAGTRIGAYEIVDAIGAGGMGDVYRARDTNLHRDVAVKVLPESMAGDPDRLARFEREARVLASISHPDIAHIYGVEPCGTSLAIIMELVPGATLAERLGEGAMRLEDALRVARVIAGALASAHDQGVVHRDLKPANVKATDDGVVKLLDFGLAKTLADEPELNASTVLSPAMTTSGVILGTAAYMSPEQARGRAIDKRTDVWAFGCVLHEMLTGVRAFDEPGVQDTIVAILTKDPDWSRLPPSTPASIRLLLKRCLERDRARRLADLHDAALEIDHQLSGAIVPGAVAVSTVTTRGAWLPWILAAVTAIAALGVTLMRPSPSALPELRLDIVTPPTPDRSAFALSPDGMRLVAVATVGEQDQLWLRDLRSTSAAGNVIAGTTGASLPFWSPDGGSIGFFAEGRLKAVELASGAIQNLAEALNPRGGTWNSYEGGTIVYARGLSEAIWRIPARGGQPRRVTTLQPGQVEHRHPVFLGDTARFTFVAQSPVNVGPAAGQYLADLNGQPAKRIGELYARTVPVGTDRAVFLSNDLLLQTFDASSAQLTGATSVIARNLVGGILGNGGFAIGGRTVAYRTAVPQEIVLQAFRRDGTLIRDISPRLLSQTAPISPDGRRVLIYDTAQGIRTVDLATGRESAQGPGGRPLWAPGGKQVIYQAAQGIARKAVDTGERETIVVKEPNAWPTDFSPDGHAMLYVAVTDEGGHDVSLVDLRGGAPIAIARSSAREYQGQLSPDLKWVAYTSNETGQPEVWVKRLGAAEQAIRVTQSGGMMPRWRRDGRELFYMSATAMLSAVPVEFDGNRVVFGKTEELFRAPISRDVLSGSGVGFLYAVNGDGNFVVSTDRRPLVPVTVVLNWNPDAQR